MDFICEKDKCCGCKACENICPRHAIKMVENEKGFLVPIIDLGKCVDCNLCITVCPEINKNNFKEPIKIFACKNKNFEQRMTSSSGGFFVEICKYLFENNGIVWGATFNKEHKVEHNKSNNLEELERIKKSKYVQSDMKDSFKQIKEELKNNKNVLFSGTPCQVQAVKNYIKGESENITYIDIVCHGVPSPKVFEDYKKYLEERYGSKIIDINFRYKNDESTQNIKVDFESGESYISNFKRGDIFYRLFLQNLILRDACYNCDYKKFERIGDISLADFWGYENGSAKDFGDKKGISLVLVNTKKGMDIFEKVKENFEYFEITKGDCYPYNCFFNFDLPENYEKFWAEYIKQGFKGIIDKV